MEECGKMAIGIKINGSKKISELQKEFNGIFPYLKLEFFQGKRGGRPAAFTGLTLKDNPGKKNYGAIILKEDMKVSELEHLFQELFGLSVQVFRKSGRSWIETTVTDDWTLKQQNEEGKELSVLSQ